ncbi:MAG: hypothetical protein HY867_14005 [Chloroflexi bacterium]|nr:hypothetical protein [Chloroflexota bacterium]
MKTNLFRSFFFVAAAAFLTLVAAQSTQTRVAAQELVSTPTPEGGGGPDCRECHWDIFVDWEGSKHGQGLSCGQCHLANQEGGHARLGHGAQGGPQQCMGCHTTGYDPATDTWNEDDVHCSACHSPIEAGHPEKPMPINRSVELCGRCHIQARFEWEISKHGQAGVACVNCHNQHKTTLKSGADHLSEQCAVCHENRVKGFSESVHAEQGVSCGDCHLANLEGPVGEGSAKRNHTFEVDVKTCTACHAKTLHNAKQAGIAQPVGLIMPLEPSDAMSSAVTNEVSETPPRPGSLSSAALSGIIGIGIGMAVLPVVGNWRKRRQDKK